MCKYDIMILSKSGREVTAVGRIKNVTFGQYFMYQKDGQVFRANEGFFNISGYTHKDLDEGRINFFNLIPEEDKDEYLAIVDGFKSGSLT